MSSVFRKDDQRVEKPNRNVYDLRKVKNITTKFGQLMPVYCKPVMNGESVTIEHKHAFNMLPLVFPVQTRVRASLQYFYVRNRNVWKDWEDFQFKMKPNLVKPYLKFTKEMQRDLLKIGGMLDNLGVDVVANANVTRRIRLDNPILTRTSGVYNPYTNTYDEYGFNYRIGVKTADAIGTGAQVYYPYDKAVVTTVTESDMAFGKLLYAPYRQPVIDGPGSSAFLTIGNPNGEAITRLFLVKGVKASQAEYEVVTSRSDVQTRSTRRSNSDAQHSTAIRKVGSDVSDNTTSQRITTDSFGRETKYFIVAVTIPANAQITLSNVEDYTITSIEGMYYYANENHDSVPTICVYVRPSDYRNGIALTDVILDDLPYANVVRDDETTIRLDAMIPRHCESVYNAFYRNAENNPYKINGVNEYNKYIHTMEGGADSFNYPLHYRNWQDDAFTTALHTPQHGEAPLVGLVNQNPENGWRVTFANDDGTKTRVHFGPRTQEGVVKVYSDDPAADGTSDGYVGQLQEAMMEAVKFGITINDFRNVNSFQRWLENNVRKGYKYRDQIKAHYGVSVRYDTLDMPEYLGGTSRDMNVNQVTQTTENENGVLGDYAGQAYINGSSEHSITQYCDEEGFIIGFLSIMPSACYSQVIPKFWTRQHAFDYFSPEFGKIGMQPILNKDVSPVSSFYDGTGEEVFGYQRPWWDYIDDFDSIHGLFRTQFKNFVITRTFDETPKLGQEFTVFDPDQVNNVFYVDDDSDKILGQILFDVKVRIPVPLYGVAALE